jgi:hypothetical protein
MDRVRTRVGVRAQESFDGSEPIETRTLAVTGEHDLGAGF